MRAFLLIPLALIAVLLLLPAPAAAVPDGFITSSGFRFDAANGVWWRAGVSYTREWITKPGYWAYGCYVAGKGYWEYTAVALPAPKVKTIPYTPDWKTQVLKVAAARDDHAAYLQALRTLGMTPPLDPGTPYRAPAYGTLTGASFQTGTFGANASTLYGYSLASVKDLYGSADLNALYQQAARLTSNAQTLAGQAHTDFSDLVAKEGGNRARIAEILAKAQAAKMALDAAAGPAVTTTESRVFSFEVRPGPDGVPTVTPVPSPAPGTPVPAPPRADAGAFRTLLATKCASCHSGSKKEAGFDVTAYSTMTPAAKAKVWGRLVHPEEGKRMPKGKPALTPEELRLFLLN